MSETQDFGTLLRVNHVWTYEDLSLVKFLSEHFNLVSRMFVTKGTGPAALIQFTVHNF